MNDKHLVFLDSNKNQGCKHTAEVLNKYFSKVLKKEYKAYQMALKKFEFNNKKYTIWFPKLEKEDGSSGADYPGWHNKFIDNNTIWEYGVDAPYEPIEGEIIVFAKEEKGNYCFKGVFVQDIKNSKSGSIYFNKVRDNFILI